MGDVQSLVQSAFDAPGCPVVEQPLSGVQRFGREAGDQGDGFRGVLAQMPAQERDLFDAGKVHLLGCGWSRAQHPGFRLALVELTAGGQRRGRLPRGKNLPEVRQRVFRSWRAVSVGCL